MAALPQGDLPPGVVVRELQVRRARTIDLGADSVGFVNAITEVARSDSLLFVLDGMAQTIRVHQESNGAFVRSFGGRGRGPGEFEDPMALAVWSCPAFTDG
ncbi:6-bladed beta-propeller [Candidatus Palauibacter sp.]|uniref:6-bladed beta-propeller n=1 Tax=Candidatus Palauibacter sp. TaxID=3101350 RepID=UPI003B5C3306